MTPGDTARVLAKIAAFDQRTIGEADVLAWHEVIGHLDAASCMAAVTTHYRENTTRIMPADVRKLATDIRVRQRSDHERRQRAIEAAHPGRDTVGLVEYVFVALANAGQDVHNGKHLGKDQAGDVAEDAAREWLFSNGRRR